MIPGATIMKTPYTTPMITAKSNERLSSELGQIVDDANNRHSASINSKDASLKKLKKTFQVQENELDEGFKKALL